MHIIRHSCSSGAKKAKGLTVIIDVFRAGNTVLACFSKGAFSIIPVGSLERAYYLKKQYPDFLLAGERNSLPPEGFDFGNSPSEILSGNFEAKNVILTTSAGTQGIVYASGAEEIIMATFANAHAVLSYIRNKKPERVSILAMGFESSEKAEEDEFCAFYLESLLKDIPVSFETIREQLMESKGAQRLRSINKEADLEFCLRLNTIAIVPRYDFASGRLYEIKPMKK